jgi:hypothetical protein
MSEQHQEGDAPRNPQIDWETSDIKAAAILKFAVYLLLTTLLVLFVMFKLYQGFARYEASQQPPPPIMRTDAERKPPLPRLQEQPSLDITQLRANENAMLSSYGWVDQQSGIARIPIADAIRVVAERGLPVRGAEAPAPAPSPAAKGKAK